MTRSQYTIYSVLRTIDGISNIHSSMIQEREAAAAVPIRFHRYLNRIYVKQRRAERLSEIWPSCISSQPSEQKATEICPQLTIDSRLAQAVPLEQEPFALITKIIQISASDRICVQIKEARAASIP